MGAQSAVAQLFRPFRGYAMTEEAQERIRRAANGALLTLLAKWSMVIIIPMSGFIAAALWTKLDKTAESTARLEEKVSNLIDRQIPDINSRFDGRFNAQSDRITAHDRRLDRLEDWRNSRGNP